MPEVPGSILGGDGQFSLAEKNSMITKKVQSVAKMASNVYERGLCSADHSNKANQQDK